MTTWVLLRGLTRDSRHWGAFPERLRLRTAADSVVALDVPGNGRLNALSSPDSVAAMVEACRASLRESGVAAPYLLLAMSLGGMIAIEWATRHPAECAGAVLINTSSRRLSPWHQRLRPRSLLRWLAGSLSADAGAREDLILRLTSRHPSEDAQTLLARWTSWRHEHPVSPANARRQLWAALRFRAPAMRPNVPLLLLASAADGLVDPACSWRIAAQWAVELRVHPSAGHDLALDDPDWVARQAADWLGSLPSR